MRVDNCVAGSCVSPCLRPYSFHRRRTDLLPKPASDCGVIKIGHCCVWRKIVGQVSPFAAVIHKVQHRIHQFSLFPFAAVSCPWKQRLNDRPLAVAQITRISASFIFLYHAFIILLFLLLVQLLKAQKALTARNREREQNTLRMRRVREIQRVAKEAEKVSTPAGCLGCSVVLYFLWRQLDRSEFAGVK